MVETFYKEEGAQILLLSYTNRAVDEICKALSSIRPEVDFIRVGSELSCDENYRDHLLPVCVVQRFANVLTAVVY